MGWESDQLTDAVAAHKIPELSLTQSLHQFVQRQLSNWRLAHPVVGFEFLVTQGITGKRLTYERVNEAANA